MADPVLLVRPAAWWFNKTPLSVMLALLLMDGRALSVTAMAGLVFLVITVCCVGNYGYALNDLFDVEEDGRMGRRNAAAASGTRHMWLVAGLSAVLAMVFGALTAGVAGLALAGGVLLLPLAYSAPPIRIKERKWLGVMADALAAHVFPAALALAMASFLGLRPVPMVMIVAALVWAAAAGVRGILSHQINTADKDRGAGLATVVHDVGQGRMIQIVAWAILPLEVLAFGALILTCATGPVLWAGLASYLAYEAARTFIPGFTVKVFRREGQPYVPFVEESFYKCWGPLLIALDAARHDLLSLALIAAFAMLYRRHVRIEYGRIVALLGAIASKMRRRRRTVPAREPYGVVTLADAAYFPGLELLCQSIQESWPIPVACFDAGLTEAQRRVAAKYPNLRLLPMPDTGLVARVREVFGVAGGMRKTIKRVWPLWICPALIAAAPFRRVFWLDCDIVVLRNLEGLFALLDDGPVFTPENHAPHATPNEPELYELLPIDRPFDPQEPRINAGVSGWDLERDKPVLDAYMQVVARACEDEQVRETVSWHDQGALIWAIQSLGVQARVQDTWAWNFCARHALLHEDPVPMGEDFLPTLRSRLPEVNLLHWNGLRPPWIV